MHYRSALLCSLLFTACSTQHIAHKAHDDAGPSDGAQDASAPTSTTVAPIDASSTTPRTLENSADAAIAAEESDARVDATEPPAVLVAADAQVDADDAQPDAQPSAPDATIAASTPDAAAMTAAAPTLRISEVGSCYYFDSACWFELYNAGTSNEELSHYQVRTRSARRVWPYTQSDEHTFQLPSYALKPGHYALIAANGSKALADGQGSLHIEDGDILPWWREDGFVELLAANSTVDFVRFGQSTVQPRTAGAFDSSSTALPSGALSYGFALARDLVQHDHDVASDFALRAFATPHGPNDVTSDLDVDADGLPDQAEVSGGRFAGVDLYAMGARLGVRDVFVEIDRMSSSDPALTPTRAALDKLVAVFAEHGISLHLDVGNLFTITFNPALYNLGGGGEVPFSPAIGFRPSDSSIADFYDYKAAHMAPERRAAFYYMLFASSQEADGSAGSSGIGEILGNDTIITLGGNGFGTASAWQRNLLANYQAATMMHELGHNLSLRHGGFENQNYKPNYVSVMNYLYGALGLPVIGSHEGDRYDLTTGCTLSYVNQLERAPTGSPADFLLDFSHGESADIDELHVFESEGVGRVQSSAVDYDCSGDVADDYAADLNMDGRKTTLRDHDDWSSIKLVFARASSSNDSGPLLLAKRLSVPTDVTLDDEQPITPVACPRVVLRVP